MKSSAEEIHLPQGVTLMVYCSHCVHDNTHSTCIASRPKWIPQAVQNQDNNIFGQSSSLVCRVQCNGIKIGHVRCMIIHTSTGYRQCPVLEYELTKPIFGYSDRKSMLIASTLIEVWWAAQTLVNWPFCCVDRHLVVPEYLWKLGWHPMKVLCAWKVCKSAKSCVKYLFGYICKAFRLLIQTDLV